jgi:hypothetical protein
VLTLKRFQTTVFFVVLGAYAGLTILQQTTKGKKIVQKVDRMGAFVPTWTFFGPQPATTDFEYLYRDKLADGSTTPWVTIDFFQERRWSHLLFHFNRRTEKAVFDIAQELRHMAHAGLPIERLQLSPGYLSMLNYITNHVEHPLDAEQTQFMIATNPGYDLDREDPALVLASGFHSLGRGTE